MLLGVMTGASVSSGSPGLCVLSAWQMILLLDWTAAGICCAAGPMDCVQNATFCGKRCWGSHLLPLGS